MGMYSLRENLAKTDPPLQKRRSICARSASAVTPIAKVQLTRIGSPLLVFLWAYRWTVYVAPKLPNGAQKRKVAVFRPIFEVVLIGSGIRTFDWYRPRWPWMTLNGVIPIILCYFTEFDSFGGRLRHWRYRPIMFPEYRLPLLAKLTYLAARSLCDSWATCTVYIYTVVRWIAIRQVVMRWKSAWR